MQRELKFQ